MNPKRIMVVGTSSSGKTTLSDLLAKKLNIPHTQLDLLFWQKEWQSVSQDIFVEKVQSVIEKDNWIIDGNFHSTFDLVIQRANILIWLDYPLPLVFFRGLRRTLKRIISKEEILNGNFETFNRSFVSKDSILLWILTSHSKLKKRYIPIFNNASDTKLKCIRLKSPKQTRLFLNSNFLKS